MKSIKRKRFLNLRRPMMLRKRTAAGNLIPETIVTGNVADMKETAHPLAAAPALKAVDRIAQPVAIVEVETGRRRAVVQTMCI